MNHRLIPFAAFALLGALADGASAQQPAPPDGAKQIGTCVVVLTDVSTTETPTGLQAYGTCTTAEGGDRSCTATIVPTGPDVILDVSSTDSLASCLPADGDDPCAQIQSGPIIFQSERQATQTYSAYVGRARMTVCDPAEAPAPAVARSAAVRAVSADRRPGVRRAQVSLRRRGAAAMHDGRRRPANFPDRRRCRPQPANPLRLEEFRRAGLRGADLPGDAVAERHRSS